MPGATTGSAPAQSAPDNAAAQTRRTRLPATASDRPAILLAALVMLIGAGGMCAARLQNQRR
jgi:hypothetical protein